MENRMDAEPPHVGRRAVLGVVLLLGLAARGTAFAQGESCTKLTTESLAIPGLVIDGSKMQEAGDGLPKHCIVTGEVNDRTGIDGKH